jgi:hypothetical protein
LDDKLRKKILFEISQIDKLLEDSKPLLDLCKLKIPDFIEMSAAALTLHSFYNGIENLLIIIIKHYHERLPSGDKWHMELLDKAFIPNEDGKQILKIELQKPLEEYLKIRHFVRHTYGFHLEWTRMEDLINNINSIWQDIKKCLHAFINN